MTFNRETRHATAALQAKSHAHAEALRPVVMRLRDTGITSVGQLARSLNEEGYTTSRGGAWQYASVRNLLNRLRNRDEAL